MDHTTKDKMEASLCDEIVRLSSDGPATVFTTAASRYACTMEVQAAETSMAHQVCQGMVGTAARLGMEGASHHLHDSGCTVTLPHPNVSGMLGSIATNGIEAGGCIRDNECPSGWKCSMNIGGIEWKQCLA